MCEFAWLPTVPVVCTGRHCYFPYQRTCMFCDLQAGNSGMITLKRFMQHQNSKFSLIIKNKLSPQCSCYVYK